MDMLSTPHWLFNVPWIVISKRRSPAPILIEYTVLNFHPKNSNFLNRDRIHDLLNLLNKNRKLTIYFIHYLSGTLL